VRSVSARADEEPRQSAAMPTEIAASASRANLFDFIPNPFSVAALVGVAIFNARLARKRQEQSSLRFPQHNYRAAIIATCIAHSLFIAQT
jgi:hypothetical protein